MKGLNLIFVLLGLIFFIEGAAALDSCGSFARGDANSDTKIDISDALFILQFLFKEGPRASCLEIADTNADGSIDLSDAIYLINYLYSGGPVPAPILLKCDEGIVGKACGCGGRSVSSGYCCFGGEYRDKPCEYVAYSESIKKANGASKNRIFLCSANNPEECGPMSKEFHLTDSSFEDANPDIGHINYPQKQSGLVYTEIAPFAIGTWQRYENGISNVYLCKLKGKEAKECELNKFKAAQGFNPSVEFHPDFNLRDLNDISRNIRTEDIIAVWETQGDIRGCVVEYRGNYPSPFKCNEKIIAMKKSLGSFAEPVLKGSSLMWKGGANTDPNSNELYLCSLKSSGKELPNGQIYPLSCSTAPVKIDSGNIGPETGDFLNVGGQLFAGYSKKIGSSQYKVYLNKMSIEFPNIYTLDSINLYHSPRVVGKGNEFYIVFKDINYQNPSFSIPSEHTIWIIGGDSSKLAGLVQKGIIPSLSSGASSSSSPYPGTGTQQPIKSVDINTLVSNGLKLFRVVSENHLSTEGPNTLCNSDSCYILDKRLGAKQRKSPNDGKFNEWNNFQNEQLVCKLNGVTGLGVGGRAACTSQNNYIERVL